MNKPPCTFCPEPGAFSPSQIKAFEFGCQRKWAFRHILNLAEPSFGFQELGKQVHKHLEDYLRDGKAPPLTKPGEIALTGLEHLPKPNKRHIIEKHIFLEIDGIAFHGFPDLIPYTEYAVDDHKTTSDFRYALTEAELKCDPQALIYGMWLALKQPLAFRQKFDLALRWHYYRTRGVYKYQQVFATLSWNELQANFSRYVLEPARKMRDIRDSATPDFDPNLLPANAGSCEAYGGCPHKSRCSLHETEKVTMGSLFRDKLKKQKHDEPTPAIVAEEIEARGVVPPDAPEPVRELPEDESKPAKAKRGRPRKNRSDATTAVVVEPSPEPKEQWVKDMEQSVAAAAAERCLFLCINTFPSKGRVTLLTEVLAPIIEALNEQLCVSHYRLAKEAEYGRADALLLAAFKQASPTLTGYVFVDKADASSAAVLGYLEATATEIFRGAY